MDRTKFVIQLVSEKTIESKKLISIPLSNTTFVEINLDRVDEMSVQDWDEVLEGVWRAELCVTK
jgi:hypothetical protein